MAEPSIATKAPESDILEDASLETPVTTTAPNTIADPTSQPALYAHCTTDRPLLAGQQPTGELANYSEIETYISKPADYPSTPAKLLILLTNGRGVHSPNNQLQADQFAQAGFIVVMPDMFGGDAAPNTATTDEAETSWLDSFKARVVETTKSFMIDMWLARHGAEKVMPIILRVLDAVKDEFADAVGHGGGVYACGYCFGAKYVLLLAGEQREEEGENDVEAGMVRKGPEIKCGAVAHGTLVTREDLKGVRVPVSLVCVENDPLFPEEVLEYGKKELAARNVKHEVKVYSGVPHGFAVVGEYDSVTIKEAQTAASSQILDWLQNH